MSKTSSARSSSVEYASDVPDTPVTADAPRQRIEVRSFWDTAKEAHKAPCLVRSLLTGVVTASAFGIVQNLRGKSVWNPIIFGWVLGSVGNWTYCQYKIVNTRRSLATVMMQQTASADKVAEAQKN